MSAARNIVGKAIEELINEKLADVLEPIADTFFSQYQSASESTEQVFLSAYEKLTAMISEFRGEDVEDEDDEEGSVITDATVN